MSVYSKQNEKARAKFQKLGHDFYYAKVTDYERRHIECDTVIRPNISKKNHADHDAECRCAKWRYNYSSGQMEKVS